jgi:hypothetical protein
MTRNPQMFQIYVIEFHNIFKFNLIYLLICSNSKKFIMSIPFIDY